MRHSRAARGLLDGEEGWVFGGRLQSTMEEGHNFPGWSWFYSILYYTFLCTALLVINSLLLFEIMKLTLLLPNTSLFNYNL